MIRLSGKAYNVAPKKSDSKSPTGTLTFAINGVKKTIPAREVDPNMTLNEYIRTQTPFRGTKLSCGEGGCGACAVSLSKYDPATKRVIHSSCNSCLRLLATMDGWSITTVEGLGNHKKLHPVQERIAGYHGTQCGYCTPGMVMTLYSMMKARNGNGGKNLTMQQLEGFFDGNICRCTGYRPILDAAKSFAKDSDVKDYINIEKMPVGPYDESIDPTFPDFLKEHKVTPLRFRSENGVLFQRPTKLKALLRALQKGASDARLVVGNTMIGIYKQQSSKVFVDAQNIKELNTILVDEKVGIIFGANTSLASIELTLRDLHSRSEAKTAHKTVAFPHIADHILKIANHHVRNVGSVAGNLVMAKTKGFLSDIATIFLGASASVTLTKLEGDTVVERVQTLEDFLASPDLNGEVVKNVILPWGGEGAIYRSYKVALRPVNAHAYLNAAFYLEVHSDKIQKAVLAFGGVQPWDIPGSHAIRAKQTEAALVGKPLSKDTFKAAFDILNKEIKIENKEESAAYRNRLSTSFFFKFQLAVLGNKVGASQKSGGEGLARPVSHGVQSFVYDKKKNAPAHLPIAKLEGKIQSSGEAVYTLDNPVQENTLHAAYVYSTIARGTVVSIDTSEAEKVPGYFTTLTAKDVPGVNLYSKIMGVILSHQIFADKIEYYHQPVGLVLADKLSRARRAAALVKVEYKKEKPILTISEAKALEDPSKKIPVSGFVPCMTFNHVCTSKAGDMKTPAPHSAKGVVKVGTQKHFYMETQATYVVPDEEGRFIVYVGTQSPGDTNGWIADALGIDEARIKIVSKRAGGGFGGKAFHASLHACAASVASFRTSRPVRLQVDRNDDMAIVGGREEVEAGYEVGYDETGRIISFKSHAWLNGGCTVEGSAWAPLIYALRIQQSYDLKNLDVAAHLVKTNICTRGPVRGPADPECGYVMETAIEHIAHKLGLTPEQVRERNFYAADDEKKLLPQGIPQPYYTVLSLWKRLKEKINYEKRVAEVNKFNAANRWKKRGLSLVPVTYAVFVFPMSAVVNLYKDGSILIGHSGCEMGQGLNTKAAQVAAMELGDVLGEPIPLERIRIQELNSNLSPNGRTTGGSTGSETVAAAVLKACKQLSGTLKEVVAELVKEAEDKQKQNEKEKDEKKGDKEKEGKDALKLSWNELCATADKKNRHLQASVLWSTNEGFYCNYGVAASELEVDTLTGETQILMSSMVYDCGKSLNPAIDIGQLEGGFMMGIGLWLREQETYDLNSGKLLSDGTWMYKPPSARDVPLQFETELIQNESFDKGVLSSKASGEPPLVLSASVILALRQAITAARKEAGLTDFFELHAPATPEIIANLCATNPVKADPSQ